MTVYVPILKGREAELVALGHLDAAAGAAILPILEVPPTNGDPIKDAYAFVERARKAMPAGLRIGVDVGHLPDPVEGLRAPAHDVGEDLHCSQIPMVPVIRLSDSDARLADHGWSARLHGHGAVVRLGSSTADPNVDQARSGLPRVWRLTRLSPQLCDLVVDLFAIGSRRDVDRVAPVVRGVVGWARRYGWRSVVVAAGAIPDSESISRVPRNRPTSVPRWDFTLWREVADLGVDFGDYGIGHPAMQVRGWPPLPNLRYTARNVWWIYRWARGETGGNDCFYDLCAVLVAAGHWPGAEFSWGDGELARRAVHRPGPGGATQWLAWGTSHHLAHVIHELATAGGV